MKKILVLGSNGFIGHHLTRRILAQTDLRRLGREIRGFRRYSIIARDENGTALTDAFNFGLGGNKWVVANLEYHFLTGGPFRFVLFADAGNVYAQSQSWDVSRLRYTAGAEFRILVPVLGAPLRFIYAVLFLSALSFLGLGVQPPESDWGGMVKDNKDGIVFGIGAALLPAAAIAILAISVNLIADWVLNRTSSLKGGRG